MESVQTTIGACLNFWQCILPIAASQQIHIGNRRFRIVRQIAEGGYSFVYLVEEEQFGLSSDPEPRQFALKKVLAGTAAHADMATREISVMQRLRHPNLLPLLASSHEPVLDEENGVSAFYMLFPLYEEGSLVDLLERLKSDGAHLPLRDVLSIFLQVCSGVRAMHQMQPPLAHRDVKPHNVLIRRHSLEAVGSSQSGPSALGGRMAEDVSSAEAQPLRAEQAGRSSRYHAVLMDFGSAQPAHVTVQNRQQALAVQEDAEAHCSAPYRSPELFDVPSQCQLDERVDVWSLGCLLYFIMYGASPFERAISEAGGSLMLAVLNGAVWFPRPDVYPREAHDTISFCLMPDPAKRPFVGDIIARVQDLVLRCEANT